MDIDKIYNALQSLPLPIEQRLFLLKLLQVENKKFNNLKLLNKKILELKI